MIRRLQAVKKDTGQSFAVKIIERANAAFDIEALKKEIDTMQRINHPNCIRLHDVFEEVRLLLLPAPRQGTWIHSVRKPCARRSAARVPVDIHVRVCVGMQISAGAQ